MESFRRLLGTMAGLISSLFTDRFDEISDGIETGDLGEIAKNVTLLCVICGLFFVFGYVLVLFALHNSVKLVIIGFLIVGAYSLYLRLTGAAELEPIHKPTMEDYLAVLETIKPALRKVAPVLGLAPIYDYTDITLDADSAITPYGKVYRMCYGALKKTAGVHVDTDMCKRVLQLQVKKVLEFENPSGFSNIRVPWGGRLEPIVQVDFIDQDDAYLYVFALMASQIYFQQRDEWEKRRNKPDSGADTDDTDF